MFNHAHAQHAHPHIQHDIAYRPVSRGDGDRRHHRPVRKNTSTLTHRHFIAWSLPLPLDLVALGHSRGAITCSRAASVLAAARDVNGLEGDWWIKVTRREASWHKGRWRLRHMTGSEHLRHAHEDAFRCSHLLRRLERRVKFSRLLLAREGGRCTRCEARFQHLARALLAEWRVECGIRQAGRIEGRRRLRWLAGGKDPHATCWERRGRGGLAWCRASLSRCWAWLGDTTLRSGLSWWC